MIDKAANDAGDSASDETVAELDASGLYCPEPVMMLHNKIREIEDGQLLKLKATDPSTTRDVPKFCLYLGHELVSEEQNDDAFIYIIRKKAE